MVAVTVVAEQRIVELQHQAEIRQCLSHDGAEVQMNGLAGVESTGSCIDGEGVEVAGVVGLVAGVVVVTGVFVLLLWLEVLKRWGLLLLRLIL